MTNERARMIYYQELYQNEKREHNEEIHEKESIIKHLQYWLAIVGGSWIATVLMMVYVLWVVL